LSVAASEVLEIERAAVRSWPALETARHRGWLLRYSTGGSVRANSVSALEYLPGEGGDAVSRLDDAIERVARFYQLRGAVPRFTIVPGHTGPADLDEELERRGWQRHGDHVTMAKAIATPPAVDRAPWVTRQVEATEAWLGVYLGCVTPSRRGVASILAKGVPDPRAYFGAAPEGEMIATGLSVLDGSLASVQCMATLPAARRRGAARQILTAIEDWACARGARRLYLQTDLSNVGAIRLYESVGYAVVARYHTRELTSQGLSTVLSAR
jgi:GNAT superfamily N-acetyltransferase